MSVHYQALQNICMYSQSIIFLTADSRVSVRNILKEREREGTNNPPPPPAYGPVSFAAQVVQTAASSVQCKTPARDVFQSATVQNS